MNWDAIGAFGEWAGAIVVIVTLVYLARQIRQNSELSRLALYSNDIDSYMQRDHVIANEPLAAAWSKAIEDPRAMTASEMLRVDSLLLSVLTQLARRHYLYDQGFYKVSAQSMASQELTLYFCNEYAKAWGKVKREDAHVGLPSPNRENFFKEISPMMSELDASGQSENLSKIKALLNAKEN